MKLPLVIVTIGALVQLGAAFTVQHQSASLSQKHSSTTTLFAYNNNRSQRGKEKSKRQFRVSQLVQTELGRIIHTGIIKGDSDYLDDVLRKRISIVSVDISPDLRQARVSTSIRNSNLPDNNEAVDKRRAYSWLVKNTWNLRHTLAQRMSHMKSSPTLTFVQVDVAAAVDVMYLIEKVSQSGFGRENVGEFGGDDDTLPRGFIDDMDFDEEFDDEDWEEEDDGFFDSDEDEDKA